MFTWCYILASVLGAVVALYGLLEIHYFLRMCLCVILARYIKRKSHILDTTTVTGICLTTDIDTLLYHMNNARYLRELDFARVDFYERTKLYKTILSKGGAVVQGAATIRYRRFIRPFAIFKITSKIIYWDDQSVFMEHRFISPKDNFVHCIAVCRQRLIDCSAEDVMGTLLNLQTSQFDDTKVTTPTTLTVKEKNGSAVVSLENSFSGPEMIENGKINRKFKPEMPLDVGKWMEYNDISSKNLRNGC